MFQTHSFEAFNPSSHANLKCSLKYHLTDSSLSSLSVDYFFGLSEKYQLAISESTLSYDMAFVFGDLKGFYDYLHSIHQESKFEFCEFQKEQMKVSFMLKVFNQEKKVQQDFKSTHVNDEVIWKSELKSKLQSIQLTMNNRMENQVDRKVRHSMIDQRERNYLKTEALEQKVNRQISIMKDKLDLVVNFINRQETTKEKLEFKDVRFRGRYDQRKESKKSQSYESQEDERGERRNTRSFESIRRTRPIQKDEKPPQRPEQLKSIKFSRELKKIIGNSRNSSAKIERNEKPSAASKIQEWEKQYERLNFTNNMKVYPIFQKSQTQNQNQNLNNTSVQKRSRGRPVSKFKQLSISRPLEEPFIIQKFQRNVDIEETKNLRQNGPTLFSGNNKKNDNFGSRVDQSNIWSRKGSQNQEKGINDQSRDSKSKEVETAMISKGEQVARSLQQALRLYDPKTKNQENQLNQSARKNSFQNEKMIDEAEQKFDRKSFEKMEYQRKRKLSQDHKSIDLRKQQEELPLFRRQMFQKNSKFHETIDLEDEQEYKKFINKIKSAKPQQHGSANHFGKIIDEKIKMEEEETNNQKKRNQKNTGEQSHQILTKQIANRIASRISDKIAQIENLDESSIDDQFGSDSENQINKLDKMVETYKKQKRQERQDNYINKMRILNDVTEIKQGINHSKQKDIRQSVEEMSNIKMHTTPNSKASLESLHQMVDPDKSPDIENISPAKIPTYSFLDSARHFVPDFTPNPKIVKMHNARLQNYFEFEQKENQIITKASKTSRRGKKEYIPLVSSEPLPRFGKHFWSVRILWSGNYHICMGIVDMPSEIKLGQIPKNCDALYVLDGGLHDERGGNRKQNGWRPKDGAPVDVLQMELWMDKGEMYVIMVVDMDREEMSFYYNDQFISKTEFSTWCRKNKKRLHPYLALKTEKDCIEVV